MWGVRQDTILPYVLAYTLRSFWWLKIEWLWQEPLPSPVRVVAAIAGVDPALTEAFERALRGEE